MKTLCKAFFICLLSMILLVTKGESQTIQIQGEQTGILQADTIFITGNVLVPFGEFLKILPGTKVIATGYFGFFIEGSIQALGTVDNPVLFTISDTSGFYNLYDSRGGWDGFDFTNISSVADSSIFKHSTFEFGKATGDSLSKMGGMFNIRNFNKIKFTECHFNQNKAVFWGGAIFGEQADISIENCLFSNNYCGTPGPPYGYGGAVCFRNSTAEINKCEFEANRSTGIGGGVSFEYSDILLTNCKFRLNYSGLGGALGYLRSTPARSITGNLFTENSALFFGGAISCNRANPHFTNNTITNNSCTSYGGGFYCNDSAAPVVVNTILYGNHAPSGEQVYIWDVNSAPSFYYCNIEGKSEAFGGTGGTGFNSPYVANIDTLPAFLGNGLHPYALAPESPCVNAGQPDTTGLMLPAYDLAGNSRIYGSRVDIGAYELQSGPSSVNHNFSELKPHFWPNPFTDLLYVNPAGFSGETVLVQMSDLQGRVILSENIANREEIKLDLTKQHLRAGIYCLQISDSQKSVTLKISKSGQ